MKGVNPQQQEPGGANNPSRQGARMEPITYILIVLMVIDVLMLWIIDKRLDRFEKDIKDLCRMLRYQRDE